MTLRHLPEAIHRSLGNLMNDPSRRMSLVLIIVLSCVAVGGAADLWSDGPDRWWTVHAALEILLILLSTGCLVYFWRSWRTSSLETVLIRSALARSERSLAERQAERDQWRTSAEGALRGLGHAIDSQFSAWGLTPTEREVAVLILKGLGHKQIAGQTGRSERTVRQHAASVYGKAGLSSRAELAAFFLQDLALPPARD